jgi:hypothetical protein
MTNEFGDGMANNCAFRFAMLLVRGILTERHGIVAPTR